MDDIDFVMADQRLVETIIRQWQTYMPTIDQYIVLDGGFTLVAMHGDTPVGLIAIAYEQLPAPLDATIEASITDIDVLDDYRRRGIAQRLVEMATERARQDGAYQLTAWSTDDKIEAIPMWRALGFGLSRVTHAMWDEEVTGYFATRVL